MTTGPRGNAAADSPLRLALVVLGLSLAVYAASTLTGLWLGNPPWWDEGAARYAHLSETERADWFDADFLVEIRRDGSSIVVVLAGLALTALGAFPKRGQEVSGRESCIHGPVGILSSGAILGILLLVLAVFLAGVAVLGPFSTWALL